MAKLQRDWARKQRKILREVLGGKCARCGCKVKSQLTFGVIVPCDGGKQHKIEWSWRMSFYRAQMKVGNLQLLCKRCNPSKGNR